MPSANTDLNKLEKTRFAHRLSHLLFQKGMSATDLAAAVWGREKDARGYSVAKNRDLISQYLKGRSAPNEANLAKIAGVLGVQASELLAIPKTDPDVSLTTVENGNALVRINKVMSMERALRVMAIVSAK